MKWLALVAVAAGIGCAHMLPGEEPTAAVFHHGDGGSPENEPCICGGTKEHLVCECEPAAVQGAVGIWK